MLIHLYSLLLCCGYCYSDTAFSGNKCVTRRACCIAYYCFVWYRLQHWLGTRCLDSPTLLISTEQCRVQALRVARSFIAGRRHWPTRSRITWGSANFLLSNWKTAVDAESKVKGSVWKVSVCTGSNWAASYSQCVVWRWHDSCATAAAAALR